MTSNEIIEKMIEKYDWFGKEYCRLIDKENTYKSNQQVFEEMASQILEDLEILDILRKHLYVAPELVELKMTGQEYADIHNVKTHNGIPIVADRETFNKINDWFKKRGKRK